MWHPPMPSFTMRPHMPCFKSCFALRPIYLPHKPSCRHSSRICSPVKPTRWPPLQAPCQVQNLGGQSPSQSLMHGGWGLRRGILSIMNLSQSWSNRVTFMFCSLFVYIATCFVLIYVLFPPHIIFCFFYFL